MQPVAGYVLDVLGTKIGYAFFAIAWGGNIAKACNGDDIGTTISGGK